MLRTAIGKKIIFVPTIVFEIVHITRTYPIKYAYCTIRFQCDYLRCNMGKLKTCTIPCVMLKKIYMDLQIDIKKKSHCRHKRKLLLIIQTFYPELKI